MAATPEPRLAPAALPLLEPEAPERVDAARNRERILATAARLFGERGADCVSMDEVADAAGVGKGTVFPRFGSRAGLAPAVPRGPEGLFPEDLNRGGAPPAPGAPAPQAPLPFGEGRHEPLRTHA